MLGESNQNNPTKNTLEWSVYVEVKKDNQIVIASPVQDMGQHMKTTGVMMIAEEMDADWDLVSCIPGQLHIQRKKIAYKYASMNTGGSHAVRKNWDYLRRAGAIIRALLIQSASTYWNVPISDLSTKNSYVINKLTGQKLPYGALASIAKYITVNEQGITLKDFKNYNILGKSTRNVDIDEMIMGKPLFAIDMQMDHMLYATIERAPTYRGTIVKYSDTETLKVKGVIKTIKLELSKSQRGSRQVSEGVAVVAESYWAALKGRQKLKIQWKLGEYANESSEEILADFKRLCDGAPTNKPEINDGDIKSAMQSAHKVYDRKFTTQLLAHLSMEPLNAIVHASKDQAKIIVGHQDPLSVAYLVANELGINIHDVEVVSTRMGGSFGRKSMSDWVLEATKVAKHCTRPVKLVYTREDDTQQNYFGQGVHANLKVAVDKQGNITGWHNKQAQISGAVLPYCFPQGLVENFRIDKYSRDSGTPIGPWRGPGHVQNCFISESMIDEIAHDFGRDPLEYRIALFGESRAMKYVGYGSKEKHSGRMLSCYKKVAELANWKTKRPKGVGLGMAGHFTFGSYAAFVVEYDSREKNKCKISNVWGVIDCGFGLNPNHIISQMEGGFIDGLNAALYNNVRIKHGAVVNDNYDQLHFMRLRESPQNITIEILKNDYPPTGVGEPPTAPAGAALSNAIWAATGVRQREFPLKLL